MVGHCGLWLWLVVGAYVWSAGNVQCVGMVVGRFVGACFCSVRGFQAIHQVAIQGGGGIYLGHWGGVVGLAGWVFGMGRDSALV